MRVGPTHQLPRWELALGVDGVRVSGRVEGEGRAHAPVAEVGVGVLLKGGRPSRRLHRPTAEYTPVGGLPLLDCTKGLRVKGVGLVEPPTVPEHLAKAQP